MKWAWFIVLEMVADALKKSVDDVQKIGVIEFLNWWAYKKEQADKLQATLNNAR